MGNWYSVPVMDGTEMRVYVATPKGKPKAGIFVLQEAFGVNHHIQEVTRRFAELGYLAAAPELFHRTAPGFIGNYNDLSESMPHIKTLTNAMFEADIEATYEWLKKNDAHNIAAVGFCMGGKAAFIANAVVELRAAASFYGSGIPGLLSDYAEKQQAPLLLGWGGEDKHISPEARHSISETLRAAGKEFDAVEFSGAEHGFMCDERKAYDPTAAHEAWALLTAFLAEHLN